MAVTASEIRLEPQVVTFGTTDVGAVEGVSLSMSVDEVGITADQTGGQLLDSRITAVNCEVSMTIKETSATNFEKLLGDMQGGSHTPASGTALHGLGTDKLFKGMSSYAAKLKLKPVGATDDSRNIVLHKAYCIINSISYSGTEVSTMEVTFKALQDTGVDSKIDVMSFGDDTQDLS